MHEAMVLYYVRTQSIYNNQAMNEPEVFIKNNAIYNQAVIVIGGLAVTCIHYAANR
jgi:hypothetical protein